MEMLRRRRRRSVAGGGVASLKLGWAATREAVKEAG